MREARKSMSQILGITAEEGRTADGSRTAGRARSGLLEGVRLGSDDKLDADQLLSQLKGQREDARAEIFKKFAAVSGDRLARRDAAMDLIVALNMGDADAALALGHMKATEGIRDLQLIARRCDDSEACRNSVKALCMFGFNAFIAVDEIAQAFLEMDGLEKETADALSKMGSFGLSVLEGVLSQHGSFSKKKILAALEAIGGLGAMAQNALLDLELKKARFRYDPDLDEALNDAIRKIKAAIPGTS